MNLGIVALVGKASGGIFQYSVNAIRELYRSGRFDSITVFSSSSGALVLQEAVGDDAHVVGIPEDVLSFRSGNMNNCLSGVDKLDFECAGMNTRARDFMSGFSIDVLFYTSTVPTCFEIGLPYILAVHDINHREAPWFYELGAKGIWRQREYLFRNSIRYAGAVVVDSEVSRAQVLQHYGEYTSADKIFVLPYLPFARGSGTVKEIKLPKRYIFYPAQFWEHKNHLGLVNALGELRDRSNFVPHLVLVGDASAGFENRDVVFDRMMDRARELGVDDSIVYLGYVDDEELRYIYRNAAAVVFVSLLGPTNIPPLEAFSFGVPLVVSDIPGEREQVGKAGLYVDPSDPISIAYGINKVLGSEALRADFVAEGYWRLQDIRRVSYHSTVLLAAEKAKSATVQHFEDAGFHVIHSTVEPREYLATAVCSLYKASDFFEGFIQDIQAQSLYIGNQLEVVLVVDGDSSPEEMQLIERFVGESPNFVVLQTTRHCTIYECWNYGIEVSRGKHITNANVDDRHRPDSMLRLASILEVLPDVALVYPNQYRTHGRNETFESMNPHALYRWREFDRSTMAEACYMGPQPMWRKSLHEKYGMFDGSMTSAGDWEFWLRIAAGGEVLFHVDEYLGLYYESSDGAEHRDESVSAKEQAVARDRYFDKLGTKEQEKPVGLKDIYASSLPDASGKATISLCMIVRDESDNLGACLDSVAGVYDELIVVDTGSVDDTVSIAESYGAIIVCYLWDDDFASARNAGLDQATSDYIFWMDADDRGSESLVRDIRALADSGVAGAYVVAVTSLVSGEDAIVEDTYHVRLFSNRPEHRFNGVVHEDVADALTATGTSILLVRDVVVEHTGYTISDDDRLGKAFRNRRMLMRALQEQPTNVRYRYHLGVVCSMIGDHLHAVLVLTGVLHDVKHAGVVLAPADVYKAYYMLVSSFSAMRLYPEARRWCEDMQTTFGDSRHSTALSGIIYLNSGDYGRALGEFFRAKSLPKTIIDWSDDTIDRWTQLAMTAKQESESV